MLSMRVNVALYVLLIGVGIAIVAAPLVATCQHRQIRLIWEAK